MCDYCTGSYYVSGNPAFGPCVCCTPEALIKAKRLAALLKEGWRRTRAELLTAKSEIEESEEYLALKEVQEALRDAFQNYLVSLGLPAAPVVLEDHKLAAIWELLT